MESFNGQSFDYVSRMPNPEDKKKAHTRAIVASVIAPGLLPASLSSIYSKQDSKADKILTPTLAGVGGASMLVLGQHYINQGSAKETRIKDIYGKRIKKNEVTRKTILEYSKMKNDPELGETLGKKIKGQIDRDSLSMKKRLRMNNLRHVVPGVALIASPLIGSAILNKGEAFKKRYGLDTEAREVEMNLQHLGPSERNRMIADVYRGALVPGKRNNP